MIEIGLTGGIGSGKSTVADALVKRGAVLIDADRIARELQAPGRPVFMAMVERWGDAIVAEDGSLNRQAVADIVFSDPDELAAINAIVHPALAKEMADRRKEVADSDGVLIIDIPLLVGVNGERTGLHHENLAGIIVVDVEQELAIERLAKHRGFSVEDAQNRMANQASRADRVAVADFVVDNSGSREDLEREIDRCWKWIRDLPSGTG